LKCCHLNVTQFTAASTMSHEVQLEHAVHLFDKQAKQTPLERIFTPGWMRRHVLLARDVAASQDMSQHMGNDSRSQIPREVAVQIPTDSTCQASAQASIDASTAKADPVPDVFPQLEKLQEEVAALRHHVDQLSQNMLHEVKNISARMELQIAAECMNLGDTDHDVAAAIPGTPSQSGVIHACGGTGDTSSRSAQADLQLADEELDQRINAMSARIESKCLGHFEEQLGQLQATLKGLTAVVQLSERSVDTEHVFTRDLAKRIEFLENSHATWLEEKAEREEKSNSAEKAVIKDESVGILPPPSHRSEKNRLCASSSSTARVCF